MARRRSASARRGRSAMFVKVNGGSIRRSGNKRPRNGGPRSGVTRKPGNGFPGAAAKEHREAACAVLAEHGLLSARVFQYLQNLRASGTTWGVVLHLGAGNVPAGGFPPIRPRSACRGGEKHTGPSVGRSDLKTAPDVHGDLHSQQQLAEFLQLGNGGKITVSVTATPPGRLKAQKKSRAFDVQARQLASVRDGGDAEWQNRADSAVTSACSSGRVKSGIRNVPEPYWRSRVTRKAAWHLPGGLPHQIFPDRRALA